jgi:Glycosyltransferase family 87
MRHLPWLAQPKRALRAWLGDLAAPGYRARVPSWGPLALELALLLLAVWAAAHVVDLTTYGGQVPNRDVREYHHYALDFWTRPPLFRHLPVEYPPLAILPFTLTLLPPLPDALVVFEWWMAALLIAGYLWIRRYDSRAHAVTYAAYLLLGAAATVLDRYDLVPALVTLLALWAAQRRRFTLAYGLLAAGVLLKLYPAFLVPLVAIEQWRTLRAPSPAAARVRSTGDRRRPRRKRARRAWSISGAWDTLARELRRPETRQVARGVALCAGIVAAGFGIAALLSPQGALSGFQYAGSRPLQIESTPASLLWLGTLLGFPARAVYTFQSLNYVGPLDTVLEPLSVLALTAGCALVYWQQLRGRLDGGRAFVACLCVLLVANKIFSPQYLIWILPLVAYVEGFDALWVAIGLLTTLIYPFIYFAHPHINLVAPDWRFLPAVALRNALLLAVAIRAISGSRVDIVSGIAATERLATARVLVRLRKPRSPDQSPRLPIATLPPLRLKGAWRP